MLRPLHQHTAVRPRLLPASCRSVSTTVVILCFEMRQGHYEPCSPEYRTKLLESGLNVPVLTFLHARKVLSVSKYQSDPVSGKLR